MRTPNLTKLPVRPPEGFGHWLSNDRRYFRYALLCLKDLEVANSDLNAIWPGPLGQVVRDKAVTPELTLKARRRDLLSDSVKVFAAMAVEGFTNFYGAVRLGDRAYLRALGRSPLPVKLTALLKHCNGISLSLTDPLLVMAKRIASRRNALVHPTTHEAPGYVPVQSRLGDKIPDVARESVQDMVAFFTEFGRLIPEAAHHLPPLDEA